MDVSKAIIRIFCLYIAGIVSAILSIIALWLIGAFISSHNLGKLYFSTLCFLIVFPSIQLGSILGIYLLDRIVYGSLAYSMWRVTTGFLSALLAIAVYFKCIGPFFSNLEIAGIASGGALTSSYPLMIATLFSLLGYLSFGLFKKKPAVEVSYEFQNQSQVTISKKILSIIFTVILPLIILIITLVGAVYYIISIPPIEVETEKAETFTHQYVSSINDDTNFYRDYSAESVIEEIKNHRSFISKNFEICCEHSYGKDSYNYYVIYNNIHIFELETRKAKDVFIVDKFTYLKEEERPIWLQHKD